MKLFLLLAVCVATIVNGGRIHFRRTNTELVDLFSELDADLANKIAEKLETIDLDLSEPMTEKDPEKTWRAVETVVTTVVEVVPTHCEEAVAVHAVIGLTRHLVKDIVIQDLLQATAKIGELTYLENLMPRKSAEARSIYRDLKPRLTSRIHKWKIASSEASSVERDIKEVRTEIVNELKEKMDAVESAIGEIHLEQLFWEIHSIIDADILINKPIGKVLAKVATTINKYMEPFKTGKVSCDATTDMEEIERSLSDVIDFLNGGFEESLESVRIPRHMKEIVKEELIATLPKVAEILKEMVESVQNEELIRFMTSLFRVDAERVFRGVEISREVDEIVREGSLPAFVEKLIRSEKSGKIAKLMLEIPAMTLAHLGLSPEEIRYALREIEEMVVEGKLQEEAGPRGEYTGSQSTDVVASSLPMLQWRLY